MDVGNSSKKGPQSAINVTPLVDIVLVLLIIFMVLTPTSLKHLTAAVPQDADEEAPRAPTTDSITIEYAADRTLTVNGEPVNIGALAVNLSKRLEAMRKKIIFVKAEDEAPYGEVVRLMDIARGAGAETMAVVTK